MWQLTAAEDGPPVPQELASPSGGHFQAHWDVVLCNQGRKDGTQNECSSSGIHRTGCPLQSSQASIPPSQKQIPPIRKGSPSHSLPLSLQYSPSLHLSPPDPADMFISLISTTPARPLCSLCKWHPLELSNRAAGLPQNRSSLIRHLLCSKAQSRCSMHNC